MWRELSDVEWRQHELNRFRGWLLFIIILNILGILLIPVGLWLVLADPYPELSDAVPGRPVLADAFGSVVGMIGGVVALIAIWTRHHRAPEIYLMATLVAGIVGIAIEAIWRNPELPLWIYASIVFSVSSLPVLDLFIGARPNVMFLRRIKVKT